MYFEVLLERITPKLRYIARKNLLCGFYDEEDLYQEMCIYLWEKYSDGLPIGINESYVVKGCEFHIKNFLRKGRPKASISSLDMLISESGKTLVDILPDKNAKNSSDINNRLKIDQLKKIGLSDKEKEVISYLFKGYTVRDIADKMGCSHVMIIKYKKSIKKKYEKKGYQR